MTQNHPTTSNQTAPISFRLFAILMLAALGVVAILAVISYTSSGRLVALVPYFLIAILVLLLGSFLGAFLYRQKLPRMFPVVLLAIWAVIALIGGVGGAFAYQNVLPPRYQNELITQIPMLRSLLPATPAGGIIPTVQLENGELSAEDLLGIPLDLPTQAPTAEATGEFTLEASMATPEPKNNRLASYGSHYTNRSQDADSTPEVTPSPIPTAVNLISAPAFERPSNARIFGFTHIQQTWNNCGPANITMALTRYGWRESQDYAASFLKPDAEDKNVTPQEMVAFVNEMTGVRAVTRIGGDIEIIKQLIAQEFPVLIETAYYPEGSDFLGHYHTVVGYDDTQGVFYVYDSYLGTGEGGAGLAVPYTRFNEDWMAFNRVFIVIYEQERENIVTQILGELVTPEGAAHRALAVATQEAINNPRNPYAWFNRGTALVRLGDYEQAAQAYDRARALSTPFRMLWYQFGPFEAYFNIGRYSDVESLVNSNLTTGAAYVEETYYWQGRVKEVNGDIAGARESYQRALSHNNRYTDAQNALNNLGNN